jgi:hypothetical protein
MIDPNSIPQFTGNCDQLETDAAGLKGDAGHIRKTGADIHATFQGLAAFYHAPEAEQLFATTKPVADTAASFATELTEVGSALADYAHEVRPIAERLKQLKADAAAFVSSVQGDDGWKYDGDKVNRNNDLLHQVDAAVAAFWAAERKAANRIDRLFGGTQYVANDGSNKPNMYGYSGDQLDHAKVPWGTSEEESHHWYEIGHWIKSFVWDGLIVDGVWGTIKGIGTLVNPFDWDHFTQAWKGVGELAVGLAVYTTPALSLIPDSALPGWVRESKQTTVNFGKSLVAWDEWGRDPARAAGAVTFNVLTCVVAPLKAGKLGEIGEAGAAAGKAGTATKVLATLGRAGALIDPMTYVGKLAGRLPSVADVAAALDHLRTGDIHGIDDLSRVHGGQPHLPDGEVRTLNPQELADVHAGVRHMDTAGHDMPGDHGPSGTGGDHPPGGGDHPPTGGGHGSTGGDGPPKLIRQDEDFHSEYNSKGQRKAHFDAVGDLVPANPDGAATIVDHVAGKGAIKSDSAYISLSRDGASPKDFGRQHIRVDLPRLEQDIAAGRVHGVEVYSPEQVQAAIQASADQIAGRHVDITLSSDAPRSEIGRLARSFGLDNEATKEIRQRITDMMNTRRDEEWLIKGVIPRRYIEGPFGG